MEASCVRFTVQNMFAVLEYQPDFIARCETVSMTIGSIIVPTDFTECPH